MLPPGPFVIWFIAVQTEPARIRHTAPRMELKLITVCYSNLFTEIKNIVEHLHLAGDSISRGGPKSREACSSELTFP